jgi:hypothetical protein
MKLLSRVIHLAIALCAVYLHKDLPHEIWKKQPKEKIGKPYKTLIQILATKSL